MRRAGRLFDAIVERANLRLAFCRAARGKRHRPEVMRFATMLDERLADMQVRLLDGTFPVGRFRQFEIHDPKRRIITAPVFPERVLHHAIVNVCEPHFERWLIADTFACRPGKGREAAVLRAAEFSRRFPWLVHLDVRQCFDSIPHDLLRARLARCFKDRRLLDLFAAIIAGFRGDAGRGLPIGSLTSQHFANLYLGSLDRFAKEGLRAAGYVRYMDDLVLWAETQAEVISQAERCRTFIRGELGLDFKPARPRAAAAGFDFLGCRVYPTHTTLSRRSRSRYRRRVRLLTRAFQLGLLDGRSLQARLEAAAAFTRAARAQSWRFRAAVLQSLPVGNP